MSLKTQAKILRILEEQNFERVGGTRTLKVQVRVLAASNKNLEEEISRGNFREDLYFRLNVIPIDVPPLRNRIEDIPLLVEEFLQAFSKDENLEAKQMTPEAVSLLQNYRWPGNVRELKNLLERLIIMTSDKIIDIKDIPAPYARTSVAREDSTLFQGASLKEAKKEFEKIYLMKKLAENQMNISQTAEAIGIERSHLHKKIKDMRLM
jgi:two-component system nitrogen regulation response regulator NtrX